MGGDSFIIIAVVLLACAAVGMAVLHCMAREARRLWTRYQQLKAVMQHDEWVRLQRLKRQQAEARPANLLAEDGPPEPIDVPGPEAVAEKDEAEPSDAAA